MFSIKIPGQLSGAKRRGLCRKNVGKCRRDVNSAKASIVTNLNSCCEANVSYSGILTMRRSPLMSTVRNFPTQGKEKFVEGKNVIQTEISFGTMSFPLSTKSRFSIFGTAASIMKVMTGMGSDSGQQRRCHFEKCRLAACALRC